MANLRIKGDVSGYVDLAAPDVAGSTTIDLSKLLVADSSGNVGIGTSSPGRLLTLFNNDQPVFQITNNTSGSSSTNGMIFYQASGSTNHNIDNQGSGSGGDIQFMAAGSNTLKIQANGNVGIGTTSPTFATIDTYSQRGIEISGTKESGTAPVIKLTETGSGKGAFEIRSNREGLTSGNYLAFGENTDTFMVIRGDDDGGGTSTRGNVGIGTSTPSDRLEIHHQDNYDKSINFNHGNNNYINGHGQQQTIIAKASNGSGGPQEYYAGITFGLWDGTTGSKDGTIHFHTANDGTVTENMKIDADGNITANGYIAGGAGSVVQEVVMETNVLSTFSSVNAWGEPNSSYRLNITPKFSDSLIVLHYFVPLNQTTTGANNIFVFRSVRYSPNSTHLITSAGQQAGSSRMRVAGGGARAQNGYDQNDQNLESWIAYDRPGSTSQCTYGFEMKQENSDSGTIYIGHSSSDNGTWGYASRVIITAREIRQ